MAKHCTGYSVARVITLVLMRDPRVRGIIAGTYYGVMHQVGIATTYAESLKFAQDLYADTAVPDMCDGRYLADARPGCHCTRCDPDWFGMRVCPDCGNKRCVGAIDHREHPDPDLDGGEA